MASYSVLILWSVVSLFIFSIFVFFLTFFRIKKIETHYKKTITDPDTKSKMDFTQLTEQMTQSRKKADLLKSENIKLLDELTNQKQTESTWNKQMDDLNKDYNQRIHDLNQQLKESKELKKSAQTAEIIQEKEQLLKDKEQILKEKEQLVETSKLIEEELDELKQNQQQQNNQLSNENEQLKAQIVTNQTKQNEQIRQINEQNTQIKSLERQLQSLQKQNDEWRELQTKSHDEQYNDLLQKNETIMTENEQSKQQIDTLSQELTTIKNELTQKNNELMDIQKLGLIEQNNSLRNENANQFTELQKLKLTNKDILQKYESIQSDNTAKTKEITTLKDDIKIVEDQYQAMVQKYNDTYKKESTSQITVDKLTNNIKTIQKEKETLQKELNTLLDENDDKQSKIDELQNKLKTIEIESLELEKKYKETKKINDIQYKSIENLLKDIQKFENLEKQYNDIQVHNEQLQTELNNKSKLIVSLKNTLQKNALQYQTEYNEINTKYDALNKKYEELKVIENENESLKNNETNLKQTIEDQKQEIESLKTQNDDLQIQAKNAKYELDFYFQSDRNFEKNQIDYHAKIVELENENNRLKNRNYTLEIENKKYTNVRNELDNELQSSRAQRKQIEEQNILLFSLQEDLNKTRESLAQLQHDYSAEREDNVRDIIKLRKEYAQKYEAFRQTSLEDLRKENEKLQLQQYQQPQIQYTPPVTKAISYTSSKSPIPQLAITYRK